MKSTLFSFLKLFIPALAVVVLGTLMMLIVPARAADNLKSFDDYPLCSRLKFLAQPSQGAEWSIMTPEYEREARIDATVLGIADTALRSDTRGRCGGLKVSHLIQRRRGMQKLVTSLHSSNSGPCLRSNARRRLPHVR